MRYKLRPVGYDSSADFYVYVSHYKASEGDDNAARRNVEAQQVRANADTLGSAHIIYAGDFNIYTSDEPMFQTLLSAGNGQAFDPLNSMGDWHDNTAFRSVHTQAPSTTARFPGQVTGGMDDRFDFQLSSGEFMDGEGLAYISGSYRGFGNTGTHSLNGEITTGSVGSLQARLPGYSAVQTSAVLEAIAGSSDHIPVVADYQLPAKMGVQLAAVPSRVIRDGNVSVNVTVTNTAGVVSVNGADELDYALTVSGSLNGGTTGTDAALGAGNTHAVMLQTASVGARNGQVDVHSSSQGAANKDFTQAVNYTVLDHAKPYFADHEGVTTLVLDFGEVVAGAFPELDFSLGNWISPLGDAAALDLDQILVQGDTGIFTLSLAPFANLASGGTLDFTAVLSSAATGLFTTKYDLLFSDENIPGAADAGSLRLEMTVNIVPVPEPSTAALLLISACLSFRRRNSSLRSR